MPQLASDLSQQVNQRLNQVGPSGIREVAQKFSTIPGLI